MRGGGGDQKSLFAILPSILYLDTQWGGAGGDQKSLFAILPSILNVDTICAIEDYCKNNPIGGGADQKSLFAILPSET